jgi:hypothetical protein
MSWLLAAVLLAAAPLSEDQSIDLVAKAMHQLSPKQPLGCLAFQTEESSRRQFEIAVREKHGGRCRGDPEIMPVIERFRVFRSPVRLWRWDPVNDSYRRCRLTAARRPICPAD